VACVIVDADVPVLLRGGVRVRRLLHLPQLRQQLLLRVMLVLRRENSTAQQRLANILHQSGIISRARLLGIDRSRTKQTKMEFVPVDMHIVIHLQFFIVVSLFALSSTLKLYSIYIHVHTAIISESKMKITLLSKW